MAKEKRNIPIVDSPYAGYDPIRGQLSLVLVGNPVPFRFVGIDRANGRGETAKIVFYNGKMISCRKLHTRAIGYK